MHVRSLGFRTDLALLALGGSVIDDRGDHLVVRSPHNPGHWWGNFLLLPSPPASAAVPACLDLFHSELPSARHVALGFDGTAGTAGDLTAFLEAGLTVEAEAVMTARDVREPPHLNRDAEYRTLDGEDDWRRLVELRIACLEDPEPVGYREFAEAEAATTRRLVEDGHGAWFGAFAGDRLLSGLGLFRAGSGLARFQAVETRPDARGRGLAGTLVHHASRYGLGELGARTLVMVADPEYVAIRIYRSLGFRETETQLQAERAPTSTP